MGTSSNHKFFKNSVQGDDFESLPKTRSEKIHYVINFFVDDYIYLVFATSQKQLRHVANAFINVIRDVFPADTYDEEESISLKKIKKQDARWNLEKEL